jgi:4-nitrophenyl phosphatase
MEGRSLAVAVFDIDGTLAMMDKSNGTYAALPGAIAAMESCRKAGMDVWAYTNGTFFPPDHYGPRLADAGIVLDAGRVMTPASVAAHHLQQTGHKRIMVLGAEGTVAPMRAAGFDVVLPGENAQDVDAVLIGWIGDFNLAQLTAVVEAVWDGAMPYSVSDAAYFAGAKGRVLGISGSIGAMIAHTGGVTPTVLGKPAPFGLEMIAQQTGITARNMVVIGDDPALEIRMARVAGAVAVGVTTGIADRQAFLAAPPDWRADSVLKSLTEFQEQAWLFEQKESLT